MTTFLVDAHVHLYPCFDAARAFDEAAANVRRLCGEGATGWLLLTETARDDAFARLRDLRRCGRWNILPTSEPFTIDLVDDDGARLRISAGRQLQTAEGLEAHALGCDASFPDGSSLRDSIARIDAAGALPVVPWGFGKWWGSRGRILQDLLDGPQWAHVALGESGQRLAWTTEPAALSRARRSGRLVLAGTDPLPFPEQAARICGFGTAIAASIDPEAPFASLVGTLRDKGGAPIVGSLQNPVTFARNQLRMQLRKRSWSRS